jgi:hypothetical protein
MDRHSGFRSLCVSSSLNRQMSAWMPGYFWQSARILTRQTVVLPLRTAPSTSICRLVSWKTFAAVP